mgnify:CR=1 FL=1
MLINKYLSNLSQEEMEKFDIAKYKEMLDEQMGKEGADIKEKWGGK